MIESFLLNDDIKGLVLFINEELGRDKFYSIMEKYHSTMSLFRKNEEAIKLLLNKA